MRLMAWMAGSTSTGFLWFVAAGSFLPCPRFARTASVPCAPEAADRSFYCKCHGSTFDAEGRVTHGPAKRDLEHYRIVAVAGDHLVVDMNAPVAAGVS